MSKFVPSEEDRTDWRDVVLPAARAIVESYDTRVTLRQLFYRLVAAGLIPNEQRKYSMLSRRTAEARRWGEFPELIDRTRGIEGGPGGDDSPRDAIVFAAKFYQRDRTEGQEYTVYLGTEKAGIVNQLGLWFDEYGLSILPLGGYASQSLVKETISCVEADGRPAILLYAGDHDPSGWDIPRDFAERTNGCFDQIHRIVLDPDQVESHGLIENDGKETDSRKTGFVERFGRLVQVELDALDPDDLREYFRAAIFDGMVGGQIVRSGGWVDLSTHEEVLAREDEERAVILRIAEGMDE
jgi:hypothetical protein